MTRQQSGGQAGEGSKAGEAGWWIRSRGQRSEQADRGWAVGRMVRQAGIIVGESGFESRENSVENKRQSGRD